MLNITDTAEEMTFSPELVAKFDEIVSRYPEGRQKSGLLPILHLVQADSRFPCCREATGCMSSLWIISMQV